MKQLANFSKGDETVVTIQREKKLIDFKVKF